MKRYSAWVTLLKGLIVLIPGELGIVATNAANDPNIKDNWATYLAPVLPMLVVMGKNWLNNRDK